ncbi:MAG: cytochrome c-type biogenesis protein [Acidimicrobiia bacterium]
MRPGATDSPISRLRVSYVLMAVVLGLALLAGARQEGEPTTVERVQGLSQQIKCPICSGETVAESNAPASVLIREEIADMVTQSRSDAEVRDFFASRYGADILLRPPGSGLAGLVWVLPVAGFVAAASGVAFAFRRWRRWA